jgi:hypothetical protein
VALTNRPRPLRTSLAALAVLACVVATGCLRPAWLGGGSDDTVHPVRKERWEASMGGRQAAKPRIRRRLRRWPTRLIVDRSELPTDPHAFLERLAHDTWHGIEALTDVPSGLPIDHLRFTNGDVSAADTEFGDYTSTTNIGLYFAATVAANRLGLLPRATAVARLRRALHTLERLETYRGFYYNFYDVVSLERTSNFVSFVDSSWLLAGLIVAKNAFAEIAPRCEALIAKRDLRFYYDPQRHLMSQGWNVRQHRRSVYHYGTLFTEARLGSLLAIGRGEAPPEHWREMVRMFPPAADGGRSPNDVGVPDPSGRYLTWRGVPYIPSWGGSMFEALMPTLFLDERVIAPAGLGANDVAHAVIQRRYATEVLGYPVWGMSPCMTASGQYGEFGVPPLGVQAYPAGPVTPHAAALALAVTPDEAVQDLLTLAARYDVYGELGLYDSVDPTTGAVAHAYLMLDQAMLFLALANHLDGHVIQTLFVSDPIVQRALPVVTSEHFFD